MDAPLGPKTQTYQWNMAEQYKERRKVRESYEQALRWNKASTVLPVESGRGFVIRKDIKANNDYPVKSVLENLSYGSIIEDTDKSPIENLPKEGE